MEQTAKRNIAILGSTGSIGTQALEVIAAHPDQFSCEVLTANTNYKLLIEQALRFKPNAVVIADAGKLDLVKDALWPEGIKVFGGSEAVEQVVQFDSVDMVLTALVGFAGLRPTLRAIEAGKHIALANKETLVVAGKLVTSAARSAGVNIYPVDSEHSAIFQCMVGEFHNPIEKIILTASGGPFRKLSSRQLMDVTPDQALKHPNWEMGAKITIDSATLMNKGLEVIEAYWLFAVRPEQIDVVVHPQSIIHSMVQFVDGSIKAQLGLPDMKLPIQYALAYPNRLASDFKRFDFTEHPSLTFEQPDYDRFPCLGLAFDALQTGGCMPCVLNAANEVAVENFLKRKITFNEIAQVVRHVMESIDCGHEPRHLDDYIEIDSRARSAAHQYISSL